MSLKQWVASLLSRRGKSLSWYRAGLEKARQKDYRGAVADYTAAIESPHIPTDVKGMATYNRALAYAALDEAQKAADDLAAMLEMPGLPDNILREARQRRERIRRRLAKEDGE